MNRVAKRAAKVKIAALSISAQRKPPLKKRLFKMPPKFTPEKGLRAISLPYAIGSGRTLYGPKNDKRLVIRFFKRISDKHLIAKLWFGPGTQGPPLHAHGGAIAYVLDEAMGAVCWMNKLAVVAQKLEFKYQHMTPQYCELSIEAKVIKLNRSTQTVQVSARLVLPNGRVSVVARGQFHLLSPAQKRKMKRLKSTAA